VHAELPRELLLLVGVHRDQQETPAELFRQAGQNLPLAQRGAGARRPEINQNQPLTGILQHELSEILPRSGKAEACATHVFPECSDSPSISEFNVNTSGRSRENRGIPHSSRGDSTLAVITQ
jgi:hypothetical protein